MYNRLHAETLIDLWLAEDVGHGDLTSTLMIDPSATATFIVNAREPLVVAGIDVMAQVFRRSIGPMAPGCRPASRSRACTVRRKAS